MGTLDLPTLVTFGVYLVGMLAIGLWVYRRTITLDDFALGGRTLNAPTAALSAQASDMSGWLLLGLPGAIYASGVGAAWIGIGLAVGTYLNWKFVASRLRSYTERADNAVSLSAYLESRFQDTTRMLRLVSAVVIVVFFTLYVSSGLVAGGLLFEQILGIDFTVAATVAVIVIVSYTFLGGFLAVSLTDAVQGSLMWLALLIVPVVAVVALGGLSTTESLITAESPDLLRWTGEASFTGSDWTAGGTIGVVALVSSLAWGLGYFGQPHILARFMGISSASAVPAARRIGTTWVVTALAGAVAVGLVGIAYFDAPLDDPETVFLALIQSLTNPWIGGVLLAAVLAAIMSTADSQLIVVSTALTEDFYRSFLKRDASQASLVWVGRATVVGVALVAYGFALGGGGVLELVAYAWAGFGAAFGPVVVLSLFWPRMTGAGAMAGMVAGAGTVLLWERLDGVLGTGLYEMVPGVAIATVAVVVVSLFFGEVPTDRRWVGATGDEGTVVAGQS